MVNVIVKDRLVGMVPFRTVCTRVRFLKGTYCIDYIVYVKEMDWK